MNRVQYQQGLSMLDSSTATDPSKLPLRKWFLAMR